MRKLALLLSLLLLPIHSRAATLTVTTTDNGNTTLGQLSLLQAIQQANPGDTIQFNIPGAGPHVIATPLDGYPFIEDNDLTIDGYSQPGSSPNTNPILAANNAQLKIIIDSTGEGGRTLLGPLNNPGYGDSESAIFAVLGAKNFKARGLCFRSRATGGNGEDPDIYCFAFINAATGGHISGCWFGVDPDGTTLSPSGGRSSVASFKGEGGSASSGMVIGTNGDGVDDRAEFNVHCAMGLAVHLETPDVRVSGNFFNVLPDGVTILPPDNVGEAIENGAGANMLIGTNGDGVSDENERNIIGSVNYRVIAEFWRPLAPNIVFAGNYVGVNVNGSATAQNFSSMVELRKQSSIRIGSNGDGVSDDIEANKLHLLSGSTFIRWHGSNADAGGVDAAKVVFRRNHLEKNLFTTIPFEDGAPVPYSAYYQAYVSDAATRTDFAPTLTVTGGNLTGTLPPATTEYPVNVIDFYTVDPDAVAAGGIIHPMDYLGSAIDNGAGDNDPVAGQFSVAISSLSLSGAGKVTAAVTYSKVLKTDSENAVTSPFAAGVDVTPSADINAGISGQTEGTLTLSWTGGSGKFLVQKKLDLAATTWFDVMTTTERSATVAKDGQGGFFRVAGSYTGPDVIPLTAYLSGKGEKPEIITPATGVANLSVTDTKLNWMITYVGLLTDPSAAHIHGAAADSQVPSAGVMIPFNAPSGRSGFITGSATINATQRTDILNGKGYVNIHTAGNGGGEIRGQAMRTVFTTTMNGANQRPNPVDTTGTGTAKITIYGRELKYEVSWSNLTQAATAGHIHGRADATGTATVIQGFTGVSGISGNTTGIVQASVATLEAIVDGMAYVNIHSPVNNGAGEIRGQLAPQP